MPGHSPAQAPQGQTQATVGVQADGNLPRGVQLTLELDGAAQGTGSRMRHLGGNKRWVKQLYFIYFRGHGRPTPHLSIISSTFWVNGRPTLHLSIISSTSGAMAASHPICPAPHLLPAEVASSHPCIHPSSHLLLRQWPAHTSFNMCDFETLGHL